MKRKNRKIVITVGTRPNFVKVTQFRRVASQYSDMDIHLVHTGQHYDRSMTDVFFQQFGMKPDTILELASPSAAGQIGEIMTKLAALLADIEPDVVVVPGDVNSTLACALTAHKMGIPVAHLESGLRSFDRGMPEEINRILTDEIADHYFTTEASGSRNLENEGKASGSIHLVGNTMIDTLVAFENEIESSSILESLGVTPGAYTLMTMHRPSNVDGRDGLRFILELAKGITATHALVFPMHPRTRKRFEHFCLLDDLTAIPRLHLTEPLDYFSFQKLIKFSSAVLTDSGGIQEESTFRQVPCFTIRENTERPITCELGTNVLARRDVGQIIDLMTSPKSGQIPPLWDGQATTRIMDVLSRLNE